MSRYRTPSNQIDPTGAVDRILWDVQLLYEAWLIFLQLYTHSQRRMDLFNRQIPWLFDRLQGILWEHVVTAICRLTDPTESVIRGRREKNLVFERIIDDLAPSLPAEQLSAMKKRLARLKELCAGIRAHRNKFIGHLDLKTSMDTTTLPLTRLRTIDTAVRKSMDLVRMISSGRGTALGPVRTDNDLDRLDVMLGWAEERQVTDRRALTHALKLVQQRRTSSFKLDA